MLCGATFPQVSLCMLGIAVPHRGLGASQLFFPAVPGATATGSETVPPGLLTGSQAQGMTLVHSRCAYMLFESCSAAVFGLIILLLQHTVHDTLPIGHQ